VCPFCCLTMAMVLVGAASSGGLAAIVVKKVRAHHDAETLTSQTTGERKCNRKSSPTEPVRSPVLGGFRLQIRFTTSE
jgi:hypothetical protein